MALFTRQYELTYGDGSAAEMWEAVVEVETNGSPRSVQLVAFGHTRRDALEALAFECYKGAGAFHDAAEEVLGG